MQELTQQELADALKGANRHHKVTIKTRARKVEKFLGDTQ